MGKCIVPDCDMRTNRSYPGGIRFFPIPSMRYSGSPNYMRRAAMRRRAWLLLINNDDLKDEYAKTQRKICSRHFTSGCPAGPNDERNRDWLPQLHMCFDEPEVVPPPDNIAAESTNHNQSTENAVTESYRATLKQIKEEPPEENAAQHLLLNLMAAAVPDSKMVAVRGDDFRSIENYIPNSERITVRCKDFSSMAAAVPDSKMVAVRGDDFRSIENYIPNSERITVRCKDFSSMAEVVPDSKTVAVRCDDFRSMENCIPNSERITVEWKNCSSMAEAVPDNKMVTVRCDDFKSLEEELTALRKENADLKKSHSKLRNQLTEAEVDKQELKAELIDMKAKLIDSRKHTAFFQEKLAECAKRLGTLQEEEKRIKENIEQMKRFAVSEETLQDPDFVKFYTGLPNYDVFFKIVNHISLRVTDIEFVLAPWQCLLLTFMRLRLSLTLQDLGFRFRVSTGTACHIYERWLYHSYTCLESFIIWPERNVTTNTSPLAFRKAFGYNVSVVLHRLELHPQNAKRHGRKLVAPINGKGGNCVKYIIGVTPGGTVSFVSPGWEKDDDEIYTLVEAGFYKRLVVGDAIVAKHGLPSSDSVEWRKAKVLESDNGNGEVKLSSRDITDAHKLSLIQYQTDKVNSLKSRYRILNGEQLIESVRTKLNSVTQTDQIVRVCCALSNITETHR